MKFVLIGFCSLFLMSCVSMGIKNIDNVIVPSGVDKSQIEKAIEIGAAKRGWDITEKTANKYKLTLRVRRHVLVIDVPYSTESFSLQYVSSENLKHDEVRRTVHNKVYSWMKNLKTDINIYLLTHKK